MCIRDRASTDAGLVNKNRILIVKIVCFIWYSFMRSYKTLKLQGLCDDYIDYGDHNQNRIR